MVQRECCTIRVQLWDRNGKTLSLSLNLSVVLRNPGFMRLSLNPKEQPSNLFRLRKSWVEFCLLGWTGAPMERCMWQTGSTDGIQKIMDGYGNLTSAMPM